MDCPVCTDVKLAMADRQGIEIDYCPQCRGVWLDRGELDKLLERSAAQLQPTTPAPRSQPTRPDFRDSDYPRAHGHGKPYRKSWLSEIFD